MAFIGSIIAAIAGAASTVASVAGSVGSGIGSLVDGIASTVGSIASDVGSTLDKALGESFGALESGASDVFKAINSGIGEATKIETEVIGPIKGFVDEVTDFVNRINDDLIKPITDTVLKTYDAIGNLTNELHTDIHGGLKGLLQIPDAIAGALTTVDSQLGRAMQELGLANKEVVTSTLLPGMGEIFSGPLGNIASGVGSLGGAKISLIEEIGKVQLSDCTSTSMFETKIEKATNALAGNEGFVGEIGKALTTLLWMLPYLAGSVKNDIECLEQQVNKKNPVSLLGLGPIVRAFYRGILSQDQAADEANKLGLSTDRLKVLQELELWLPNLELALTMLYRNVIDQGQLTAILEKQGLTADDVAAVQAIFLEPPNPREYLQTFGRREAGEANFLPSSLGSDVPGEVAKMYPPRKLSTDQAKLDWLAHWKVPQLEWWFTAWTRGMRTESEFRLAAQAENIPFDVIDDLIPIFQEPIQLWMIPDMLGAGILSDEEAQSYLHYIGMDDKSANIIMRYGKSKGAAPAASQAADLASISASVAKTMFTDSIIDAPTYTEILLEHGYSQDAAGLTVQLAQQELQIAARKANVQSVVDQVNAGTLSEQDAVTQLYSQGYTTAEVDAAVVKMKAGSVAKTKLPTRAELDDFRKAGVITADQWAAGYQALGYTADWIPVYDAYWVSKNGGASQSTATSTAS